MNNTGKIIGERIRDLRKLRGISQEELAFKASLNSSHLSKIERGVKSPTLDSLDKIVTALEISFSELFVDITTEQSDKTIIDKINAKLNTISPKDQLAIYRLIKLVLWWKNK